MEVHGWSMCGAMDIHLEHMFGEELNSSTNMSPEYKWYTFLCTSGASGGAHHFSMAWEFRVFCGFILSMSWVIFLIPIALKTNDCYVFKQ